MATIWGVCYWCGIGPKTSDTVKLMKCGGCEGAQYCSVKCQKDDWVAHHRVVCQDEDTKPLLKSVREKSHGLVAVWDFDAEEGGKGPFVGMGRGLVAMGDLDAGTTVLEDPDTLVFWGEDDPLGTQALLDLLPLARFLSKVPPTVPLETCIRRGVLLQHMMNRCVREIPDVVTGQLVPLVPGLDLDPDWDVDPVVVSHLCCQVGGAIGKMGSRFISGLAGFSDEDRAWAKAQLHEATAVMKVNMFKLTDHSIRSGDVDPMGGTRGRAGVDASSGRPGRPQPMFAPRPTNNELSVLSVPASLLNHSCRHWNVVVKEVDGLRIHPEDKYLFRTTVVIHTTRDVPRHTQLFCMYDAHHNSCRHRVNLRCMRATCDMPLGAVHTLTSPVSLFDDIVKDVMVRATAVSHDVWETMLVLYQSSIPRDRAVFAWCEAVHAFARGTGVGVLPSTMSVMP